MFVLSKPILFLPRAYVPSNSSTFTWISLHNVIKYGHCQGVVPRLWSWLTTMAALLPGHLLPRKGAWLSKSLYVIQGSNRIVILRELLLIFYRFIWLLESWANHRSFNPAILTLKNHTNTNPYPRIRGVNFGNFLWPKFSF